MKNKLTDLNDHLFAQLERLSDEDLTGDALKQELARTNGITRVSREIINNANLVFRAQVAAASGDLYGKDNIPKMLSTDIEK